MQEPLNAKENQVGCARPDVFRFLDYREFVDASYKYLKSIDAKYSYRFLGRKIGLSASYLKMIMSKQRNLPAEKAKAVAEVFGLNQWESNYFLGLIEWSHAEGGAKDACWEKLTRLAPRDDFRYFKELEYKALSDWFVLALIESVQIKNFINDPEWIASLFKGKISVEKISESLSTLKELGIISEHEGKLKLTDRTFIISSGDAKAAELLRKFHQENIPRGINAIDDVERDLREITAASVCIPRDKIKALKEKIQNFRNEILEYTQGLENCEEVYQLNVQFFPLTKNKGEGNQ